ncbi:MAG: hypothetical protein R3A52_17880 [Polyangiales bacterium]
MADTPEPEVPKSTGTVDESTLEPVTRDVRFVVRLVMFCVVGVIAAAFVGLRMRSAAGNCGSSLVRPGGAIIEPATRADLSPARVGYPRPMHRRLLPSLALCLAAAPSFAQSSGGLHLRWGELTDPSAALVTLDHDDDDDDGVPDLAAPPAGDDDVAEVIVEATGVGAVSARVEGGLRLLDGSALSERVNAPVTNGRATLRLVGVAASAREGDAALVVSANGVERRVAVTVGALAFLGGDNAPRFGHRDALSVSHRITNDDSLPRAAAWGEVSPDPDNARVEVWAPGATEEPRVRVESLGTAASFEVADGALRGRLGEVIARRPDASAPWRTGFIRLVSDDTDLNAPGVQGQTLRVGMRDRVRATWRREGVAGELRTDLRVMRPGNEDGPLAARMARWNIMVLRHRPEAQGGRPVVGDDDEGAVRVGRRQVSISNEVYLQCAITWGDPERAAVRVVDPPPPAMLSVGDDDGMLALGGEVRFRVNGRAVGPVVTRAGWRPLDTAAAVARAVEAAGFRTETTINPRTEYGYAGSVDVIVRDRGGHLATLSPMSPGGRVSTDARQRAQIAAVDLSDGIEEFRNLNSASGTLEERAVVKALSDRDPSTIELFVVNRFLRGTRIGEAFVEGEEGSILNALFLDRVGVAAEGA